VVVEQGDVVWVDLGSPRGSEPGGRRPAVVLQHDRFNRSRIATVVVAAITSNLKLGQAPGNVRLRKGEAGLSRPSVVNVSQIATLDRDSLKAKSGHLSRTRLLEVWEGVRLVLAPPAG
jgi:mRNA interferase MazF